MKHISFIIICFALNLGISYAQNDKISFNETVHDFGVLKESDGKATCEFIITNNSDAPLLISNVNASCGCTTPKWTKEPIEPGKKGSITATYNPIGRVYPFTKAITVHTNLTSPVTLHIKGEVVAGNTDNGPRLPGKEYVVALGDYLLKTKDLNFKSVASGEVKTIRLEVFNKSEKSVTQQVKKLPKYINVAFNPEIIPANSEGTVDVSFFASDVKQYGKLNGEIDIFVNGVAYSFPYSATVLDDFSKWTATKRANAGKINVSFSELSFGNFSKGTTRTIKLSNSGKTKLNIQNIQPDNSAISVSKTNFGIEPGEIAELKVSVDGKKVKSALNTIISIISDDPKTPVLEIVVTANP
jgi:hypothetical protein